MPFSVPFTPIVYEPAFFLWSVRRERILPHFIERLELLKFGEGFATVRVPPKTLTGDILLDVSVNPGAKQSGILGYDQWSKTIKIAVTAQAEQGKANNALLHVIAELLKLPKQDLSIVYGMRSRKKKILIANQDIQLIKNALNRVLK